ncbi:hypothetical protein F444_22515 [Phytophthora nicotianae P1976]|uniref:ZSWIM1/3 RNaseH-like domain-containing protein n=2 Tax=Phytophthora nicotianae TaxID=4792 RepID=A0A080YXK0_PHYNI|nr:hypothetical protein F444_22515 [Phytophthora nicotianae P1976]
MRSTKAIVASLGPSQECSQDDVWLPTPAASGSGSGDGESSEALMALPPNKVEFASWEAVDEYVAAYVAQTFQIFRARSNTSVADRNARIDKSESKAAELPASWGQYSRTFVCSHSGKYKSVATKRPRQEARAKGCKAQINVCVQVVDRKETTFAVRITRCQLEHNHSLTSQAYFDLLLKKGVKKSGIIDHLMNHTDNNPTPKYVQNLVQKLKTREQRDGPSGTDKRLKKWMKQFGDVPGNVGRIFLGDVGDVGAKKVATCITLQAKHMRTLFDQFREVLMIDTTHGTNRSKYKVFSFMAHDTFGMAMEEVKANNPAWTRLQCVLVDKDFTELSVLEKAFPGVTILLCQFHVLKYLREEIASADYGFSRSQKEQLGGVMSLLFYAKTEQSTTNASSTWFI